MNNEIYEFYKTAGSIASQVRDEAIKKISGNVRLLDIAEFVETRIIELGGGIAFPCNISLNDTASHFTPDGDMVFRQSDVVKVDIGVHVEGYIADTAVTIEVGTSIHRDLIHTAVSALENAIRNVHSGAETKVISSVIENTIKQQGYNPMSYLTGHGLDRYDLHAGIKIPNSSIPYNCEIKNDQVIAIEPYVTYGTGKISKEEACIFQVIPSGTGLNHRQTVILNRLKDRFGTFPFALRWLSNPECLREIKSNLKEFPVIKEYDGNIVAQAEHTMIVHDTGCEVITR